MISVTVPFLYCSFLKLAIFPHFKIITRTNSRRFHWEVESMVCTRDSISLRYVQTREAMNYAITIDPSE